MKFITTSILWSSLKVIEMVAIFIYSHLSLPQFNYECGIWSNIGLMILGKLFDSIQMSLVPYNGLQQCLCQKGVQIKWGNIYIH